MKLQIKQSITGFQNEIQNNLALILEIEKYIKTWESRCYKGGIPDEVPKDIFDKAPSYKLIVTAILKNNIGVIGIERPKGKWYSVLKRIEISQRDCSKKDNQLTLF